MDTRKKKDILIVAMVFALCSMAIAYAMLSEKVEDQGNNQGEWAVEITSVEQLATSGQGSSASADSNVTTAFLATSLYKAGDSVTYSVTVENKGSMDAKLDNITSTISPEVGTDDSQYIEYTYEGIASGSILEAGDSITFTITVQCNHDPIAGAIPNNTTTLTTVLNYVQEKA